MYPHIFHHDFQILNIPNALQDHPPPVNDLSASYIRLKRSIKKRYSPIQRVVLLLLFCPERLQLLPRKSLKGVSGRSSVAKRCRLSITALLIQTMGEKTFHIVVAKGVKSVHAHGQRCKVSADAGTAHDLLSPIFSPSSAHGRYFKTLDGHTKQIPERRTSMELVRMMPEKRHTYEHVR